MDNFILLPTGKFPEVGQLNLAPHNRQPLELIWYVDTGAGLQPQYLYQTSEEEIEEGDWMLDTIQPEVTENPILATSVNLTMYCSPPQGWKRVIATTNPTLGIPLIPKEVVQEYIQHYNQVQA